MNEKSTARKWHKWLKIKQKIHKGRAKNNPIPELVIDPQTNRRDFICGVCGRVVIDTKEQADIDFNFFDRKLREKKISKSFAYMGNQMLLEWIRKETQNPFYGLCVNCSLENAKIVWEGLTKIEKEEHCKIDREADKKMEYIS